MSISILRGRGPRVKPEDLARKEPAHLLKVAQEQERVVSEGWRVKKDGSRFWADVVITALRDETGRLRGYGKLTRDLTEWREAELTLRTLSPAEPRPSGPPVLRGSCPSDPSAIPPSPPGRRGGAGCGRDGGAS